MNHPKMKNLCYLRANSSSRNISKFTTTYNASHINNSANSSFWAMYSDHIMFSFSYLLSPLYQCALSGNMIEVSMFGIDTDSVSPEEFTVNNIINGSSQAVTFEIYSIDSNLNNSYP